MVNMSKRFSHVDAARGESEAWSEAYINTLSENWSFQQNDAPQADSACRAQLENRSQR